MSKSPQNLKNHGRLDPPYHFVLFFTLVVNLIIAIYHEFRHPSHMAAWFVVLSLVVFLAFFKMRLYPLKVQDRIIRLEERLRLQALAPSEWHTQIYRLNEDQLVGLRFASDAEVVELAKHALEHNLNRKQIKERIKDWRADEFRV